MKEVDLVVEVEAIEQRVPSHMSLQLKDKGKE